MSLLNPVQFDDPEKYLYGDEMYEPPERKGGWLPEHREEDNEEPHVSYDRY